MTALIYWLGVIGSWSLMLYGWIWPSRPLTPVPFWQAAVALFCAFLYGLAWPVLLACMFIAKAWGAL